MPNAVPPNPLRGPIIEARPGTVIAIRLLTRNRMMAACLVRPMVDEWVGSDGQILPSGARIEPGYLYLLQGAQARQTITLMVPSHLAEGSALRTSLRFPGMGEEALSIEVRILPRAVGGVVEAPVDCPLEITLPLGQETTVGGGDDFGAMAQASYSLVAGLTSLDMIPARWLVAEMLTAICQLGGAHAESTEGQALLNQLGRTRFFKNGVVSFSSAQVPRWILSALTTASGLNAALGGQTGQGTLLYIWERWLLSLADGDVESGSVRATVHVPDSTLPRYAAELGTAADRWFGNLVLGLATLSPRIATALAAIAEQAPSDDGTPPPPTVPPDDVVGEGGSLKR